MSSEIDLTRGGYGGDDIEEEFKWFTSQHMEYWWHFREVLCSADRKKNAGRWKRTDGKPLSDDELKKLIALSLLHYAVYTGMVESFSFFLDARTNFAQRNLFGTRRSWKALYSSLYSSYNAFCNLTYVVICNKSPFGNDPKNPHNPSYKELMAELKKAAANDTTAADAIDVINRCRERLEIRNHLDHWWTIWIGFVENPLNNQVKFKLDHNFKKGYILVDPEKELDWNIAFDALQRAIDEIKGCAQDFNSIYKKLSVTGGGLDQYLLKNNWEVEYSDFGFPHNMQRPKP